MDKELIVRKSITVQASASTVWDALTNPELTKKYMYGCEAISDWKPGSSLVWKGIAEGKEIIYVKGRVVNSDPHKLLQYTVFDPNAGLEDVPSNYTTVTYALFPGKEGTVISVMQGDYATVADGEKRYNETIGGWEYALNGLKKTVEEQGNL